MEKNVLQTDLSGKVAVVTGAKVSLVNRSEGAINQYAAEIVEEGGIAKAYKGNVLSKEDMERIADQVLEDFGPVDILLDDKAAGFITGVVLPIDGGFSAYSGV